MSFLHRVAAINSRLPLRASQFAAGLIPSWFLERWGTAHALASFRRACGVVPAYRDFIAGCGVSCNAIKTIADFQRRAPITDKQSYIMRYDLAKLAISGDLNKVYCIQRSSGFSGKPSYWPRLANDGYEAVSQFRLMWDLYYNPRNRPTLFIVTFSMGSWTSGTDLFRFVTEIAVHGKKRVSVITPGENLPETLEIIRNLGSYYEQVLIFGNPPFVKRLLDEGKDVDWLRSKVIIGTGAEATTEAWREWVAGQLGVDVDREPLRVFNGYGSADFGLNTASETPLSVMIKRQAMRDSGLAKVLFGRSGNLPNLYQYDPTRTYFEEVDGELVVTVWSGVPLIRYNIHDVGRVLSYRSVAAELEVRGYDLPRQVRKMGYAVLKAPFLWVDGRSDGTVSIGGANVYPGNVETALLEDRLLARAVEHFQLAVKHEGSLDARLTVYLGIREFQSLDGSEATELHRRAAEAILRVLLRDNSEYEVTFRNNPSVRPSVVLLDVESLLDRTSIKRSYISTQDL